MGARKHLRAEETKTARKTQYMASLRNVPTSPRKMRLVADMIRGKNVEIALYALQYSPKEASRGMYKLLRSAIANWESKNEGERVDYNTLYVKEVFVDGGAMLKRVLPAPQGRAHRIRKRSNHVTMILDGKKAAE
ncbi:MAG TPA: 50S ribosomal protein L22 [Bacteroidales bacterium]|nr:50S ribosomal protein L22 [Bacteroidales bacterium]